MIKTDSRESDGPPQAPGNERKRQTPETGSTLPERTPESKDKKVCNTA